MNNYLEIPSEIPEPQFFEIGSSIDKRNTFENENVVYFSEFKKLLQFSNEIRTKIHSFEVEKDKILQKIRSLEVKNDFI